MKCVYLQIEKKVSSGRLYLKHATQVFIQYMFETREIHFPSTFGTLFSRGRPE